MPILSQIKWKNLNVEFEIVNPILHMLVKFFPKIQKIKFTKNFLKLRATI